MYEYHRESGHLHLLVHEGVTDVVETTRETINRIFKDDTDRLLINNVPKLLTSDALSGIPFQSALLFPFVADAQVGVVLALFSMDAHAYTLAQPDHPTIQVIRTLLENHYMVTRLTQDFATAESILKTARAIADNPSPQHVVNLLRETLFDPHISTCAMLIYGPQRQDSPFEYLEIRGTWSRRLNEFGIATGIKLYLKDYPDLLNLLEKRGIITVKVRAMRDRFDPLTRSLLRAERMRTLTLVALGTGAHKLGVLALGTDKAYEFTPHELENYRTVGEFLAISAMAQVLRSQRDRVEQARIAMTEAVTDGVLMVLPGGAGGHVLTVNNRFLNLFGVVEESATGISLLDLLNAMQVPEGVRADLHSAWQSTPVHDPEIHRGEFSMVHAEGYPIDTEWYSAPVYQDKTVLGRIYIFHDVTPERTALRLRAKFLSSISHELRTPLTILHGFVETLHEMELEPAERKRYLSMMGEQSNRMLSIVDDLLTLSTLESSPQAPMDERVDMRNLLDKLQRDAIALSAGRHRIHFDVAVAEGDLLGADNEIASALSNLLSNAIRYTPDGGEIRVHWQADASGAEFAVEDSGIGIDPEHLPRLTERFYRVDRGRSRDTGGTGLGLAIVKHVLSRHQAVLDVCSVPGQGSRFAARFPAARVVPA